jgi:Fe-S cluster biogenesis protein NfuA
MSNTLDAKEFQAELQRLDALLRDVERFPDPAAQSHMRAMIRAVLDLHGAGLARILAHLETPGATARTAFDACVHDDVIGGLLLLHGLHPLDLEARVRQALDDVRPYLRSHGGNVELLAIDGGVVRLRLEGSCHGCPSSAVTMRQTIEEAILSKAPDATAVEVEGVLETPPAPVETDVRVALPLLAT